jgi:predicted flap endonuclease-1-like 5' DNA nuclease
MNDTAPLSQGKIIVAALFGVIAAIVALVLFNFGWFASFFIGVIVAIITAIVLMLGWREPESQETGSVASQAAPAPVAAAQPAPAPAPEAAPAAEPVATPAPAPVEAAPEPTPEPAPAAKVAEPAPADPVVKPSAKLAGQEELSAKKGEWTYDGPGSEAEPAPASAEPAAAPADPAPAADASKPEFLSAAREGGADDLKQIKGVGPKLEQTLHGMGIYHFDQIAGWGPSEQAWMDDNLAGFKGRASRDNWVEQAKVLAEGGTTEFSAKVEKGGVY